MATMKIYRPECENDTTGGKPCKARATFQIVSERGGSRKFCGAHAKSALFELHKAEGETRPTPVAEPAKVSR